MKKKIKMILVLVCVAMSLIGVTFYVSLQKENNLQDNIVINLDGNDIEKELPSVNIDSIYPGSNITYTITLKGYLSEKYEVSLYFHEDKSKNNALAEYLNVKIVTKEINVEKVLKDLLIGEKVELGNNASIITITYFMPTNIGNESQDTSTTFYIELLAKNVKNGE